MAGQSTNSKYHSISRTKCKVLKSSLDRVFEVLDEEEEVQAAKVKELAPLTGQVSFKNVDFQYVENKPLIAIST